MKRIALATAPLLATSLLLAPMANAADGTSSGLYSGVGAGNTISHDWDPQEFGGHSSAAGDRVDDNNDAAQNAFIGYKYNDWFSTEIGYTDFGKIGFTGNGQDGGYKTKAYSLSAIGEMPIWNGLSGYARVGAAYWKANGRGNFADGSDVSNEYGTDPIYGVGLKYQFSDSVPLFGRLEYTRYDFDSDFKLDTTMASVGVQF
ncbi:outer membrane beta-barrel protein [Kushneria phosphatilytica]|nr:outer membrane beta-barrel protein [Kushneria phosphatilytica]OHV11840.1 hypothetical protein BH688_03885 [Kushneria phosphatilytica]